LEKELEGRKKGGRRIERNKPSYQLVLPSSLVIRKLALPLYNLFLDPLLPPKV
jgi:hypothetical protein